MQVVFITWAKAHKTWSDFNPRQGLGYEKRSCLWASAQVIILVRQQSLITYFCALYGIEQKLHTIRYRREMV